jgi:hypothetical protein
VTVNACSEFLTNSARANSSRDETKEVSGVSSTIWQFGTRAARRATRKWCVSWSSMSLAKSSWDRTRSQLLLGLRRQRVERQTGEGCADHHVETALVLQQVVERFLDIVADHAHVDIDGGLRLQVVQNLLLRLL